MLTLTFALQLIGCSGPPETEEDLSDSVVCYADLVPLFDGTYNHAGNVFTIDFGAQSTWVSEHVLEFEFFSDCTKPRVLTSNITGVNDQGEGDGFRIGEGGWIEHVPQNGRVTIPVTYSPPSPGESLGIVFFHLEALEWPAMTGPFWTELRAEIVSGTIANQPDALDARTPVGCKAFFEFEVVAEGPGPVLLNSVSLSAGAEWGWAVDGTTRGHPLDPGDTWAVSVSYKPIAPGEHDGEVRVGIEHGDSRSVQLSGVGFYPNMHLDTFVSDAVNVGFELSASGVVVESSMEVRVGGVVVSDGWTYQAASNTVLFDGGNLPDAGVSILVNYATEHDC